MTIKTTIPGTFTGALAATLPRYLHSLPTGTVARRHVALTTQQPIGSTIASIPDLTGTYAAMSGGNKPALAVDGPDVYARFDGASNYLGATDGTTVAPRTAFYVARFRGVPPSGKFYFIFNAGPWMTLANNGNIATYTGTSLQYTTLAPGTGWHVFHLTATAGSLIVGMDNQEVTLTEAASTGMDFKAQAGGRSDSTAPLAPVDFAEHITFSGVLTAQQRADTVRSLRAAYSI